MVRIDFNDNFSGFEVKEDILVDTGILLALLNGYDAWHDTVKNLFDNHVFNNNNVLFLFTNPTIINELTFLVGQGRPIEQYKRSHPGVQIAQSEIDRVERESMASIKDLIEQEVLIVLDANKDVVLKQLELCKDLGAADAVNAAIANEYGISFLTVDVRLANNLDDISSKLPDIHNLYYTESCHRTY